MRTVQSRLYTNVILTTIAILLTILALRPYMSLSTTAQAQDRANSRELPSRIANTASAAVGGDVEVANANREIAEATQEVADAIRESAKAQSDMAKALAGLTRE